jgi:phage tail sheath protein FI
MAFQVSPGVQVNEIDLTNVVPAVSTSIGGFAGIFSWGPSEEIVSVSSEKELANTFGSPNDETAKSFLTAASFLKYGKELKVARVINTANALNATSGQSSNFGLLVKNRSHYEDTYMGGTGDKGIWGAKCPGSLGNSLRVEVCSSVAAFEATDVRTETNPLTGVTESVTYSDWKYAGEFDSAPGTSTYAAKYGSTNDELHIVVIDEDGLFTGVKGTVLEKFAGVSQASDAVKIDGTSNFYKNVINNESKYIWWLDFFSAASPTILTTAGQVASGGLTFDTETTIIGNSLQAGNNGTTPTTDQISAGLEIFADADTVDLNLLFSVNDTNGTNTIAQKLAAIANRRKDVVAFLSPPTEDTVGTTTPATDVKNWADTITSTSYAVIDSTALKVYDKYNDVYRWIPAAGHVAGLCANTDDVADAWFSPAGFNRGQILGVTKLAFNPKQTDRDTLYKARINPIVSFPGQGTILYGDKTAQSKPSAFDRINVRRLFITLEKAIATAAKYQLFEFNDEFTRAMFRNMVEPFLREVQGRRGLTDFAVICDETNNTGDVIDRNEFRADIYIKPARSINFITLNFIATRTGVDFSELVGK